MAQGVSKTTTDHDTIRKWAEERGAWPAQVASTSQGGETGIVRIDFPGYTGEGKLERISWDDWFRKFDASELAFVYEETTAAGQRSSFNTLVKREKAEARRERSEAAPSAPETPIVREEGESAGRKARPRASSAAKRGGARKRGEGRRQASRGAARTARRSGARVARGGRKAPRTTKGRTRKATSRGRGGTGRSTRRSR